MAICIFKHPQLAFFDVILSSDLKWKPPILGQSLPTVSHAVQDSPVSLPWATLMDQEC